MDTHFLLSNVADRDGGHSDNVCVEWLGKELKLSLNDKTCIVPLTVKNVDDFIKWLYKEV